MVGDTPNAPDVQATFVATLVDEWIRLGVRHAVVAPGSRSTPLAVAVADRPELDVHVVHDERVAAFVALGLATPGAPEFARLPPALLVCTSGTAAANFYPAVVEAGLSAIPMLVLTADRPDELRGVGAPQTIDQIELYGEHVRWFHDPDVPVWNGRGEWRTLARRAWRECSRGPVQLNLPFREPLLGAVWEVPPGGAGPDADPEPSRADRVPAGFDRQRGVIVVGGMHRVDPDVIDELHALTQWPILADAASGHRGRPGVVAHSHLLLGHAAFAADHAPDVVVRIGRPSTSKPLNGWASAGHVLMVQVGGPGRIDPEHNVSAVCRIADLVAAAPAGASGTTWLTRWLTADRRAAEALDHALSTAELTEPATARAVGEWCAGRGAGLTVASSMPVRDVEWFGGPTVSAHANRGANGIDGVMSTALGRTLAGEGAGVVLVGDLAYVHDSNALVALKDRDVDLKIVVVDNDGGGIFSFLPQATALPSDRFERLFGTPLGADVLGLAAAHGLPTHDVSTPDGLRDTLDLPGTRVIRIASERSRNVEVHTELYAAVAAAFK